MLTLTIQLFERDKQVAMCPYQEAVEMGMDVFIEVQALTGRTIRLKYDGNWPEENHGKADLQS